MSFVILAGFAAILVYFGVSTYIHYMASSGTVWQRLLASARDSATVLWGRFVAVLAAVVGVVSAAGDALGIPGVQKYAETVLANPKWVAVAMLAFSAITVMARKRTL